MKVDSHRVSTLYHMSWADAFANKGTLTNKSPPKSLHKISISFS